MVPDREACLELLEEAGCSQDVLDHVHAVEALARELAKYAPEADHHLITAGALLHDIGRSVDHGPQHVPFGVAFLQQRDVDERVLRMVARHMGAGLSDPEAKELGFPLGIGYTPETLEERILAHADNLTFGTEYKTLADVLEKLEARGLDHVVERMHALHEGLAAELHVDPDAVSQRLADKRS